MIAVMPRGGMSNEATHCQNFSSIGKSTQVSISYDSYLVVEVGDTALTLDMPVSMSAMVVVLGDNSPRIDVTTSTSETFDENGMSWH